MTDSLAELLGNEQCLIQGEKGLWDAWLVMHIGRRVFDHVRTKPGQAFPEPLRLLVAQLPKLVNDRGKEVR